MHQVHYKNSLMFKHQQGVTLIEVLVSIVLMAIIGLGAAYISGRTAVLHRDQNIHLHTVNQMRQQLESLTDPTVCLNKLQVLETDVNVTCATVTKNFDVRVFVEGDSENRITPENNIEVKYQTIEVSDTDFAPIQVKISP